MPLHLGSVYRLYDLFLKRFALSSWRIAMRSRYYFHWLAAFVLTALPSTAFARIKLITLPVRERVEIQLDNPSATLVEEERIVPLVRGVNQVDFSWANTQIDPGTIVFRVLGGINGDKAGEKARPWMSKFSSVSYPPNEASLVWQVSSSGSGSRVCGSAICWAT